MDRLPTELVDHIVYYVEGLTNTSSGARYLRREIPYPSSYRVPTGVGLDTLRVLRLVNSAFYQSASSVLFRSVIVDIDPDLSPKRSTTKNLEDLIKDDFAQFVREIR